MVKWTGANKRQAWGLLLLSRGEDALLGWLNVVSYVTCIDAAGAPFSPNIPTDNAFLISRHNLTYRSSFPLLVKRMQFKCVFRTQAIFYSLILPAFRGFVFFGTVLIYSQLTTWFGAVSLILPYQQTCNLQLDTQWRIIPRFSFFRLNNYHCKLHISAEIIFFLNGYRKAWSGENG